MILPPIPECTILMRCYKQEVLEIWLAETEDENEKMYTWRGLLEMMLLAILSRYLLCCLDSRRGTHLFDFGNALRIQAYISASDVSGKNFTSRNAR